MHILISALSRFNRPSGICRYATNLAKCLEEIEQISRITLVLGSWQEKYFIEDFQIDSEKIKRVGSKVLMIRDKNLRVGS